MSNKVELKCTIHFHDNGKISRITYYENDPSLSYHHPYGPAEISFHDNGEKAFEAYIVHGCYHREDGPAIIYYSDIKPNVVTEIRYYHKDNKHRVDGPASIYYDENGDIKKEKFFLFGVEYSHREWLQKTRYPKDGETIEIDGVEYILTAKNQTAKK